MVTSTVSKPAKSCPIHDTSSHNLTDCNVFLKMSVSERQDKLKELKLCFLCFSLHLRKNCKQDIKCSKCSKTHNTLLHRDTVKPPGPAGSTESTNKTSMVKTSFCTRVCHDSNGLKNCSKTLLVELTLKGQPHRTLRCYAIVDEHSDATIVDPKVPQFFGVDFPTVQYSLATVNGSSTQMEGLLVSGLFVKGVGEKKRVKLPPAVTNSSLPDTKHEVATPQIVGAHRHLEKYASAFHEIDQDAEVLILIGRDCGEAMTTRCFGGKAPWAHKTPLGWAIVGITCIKDDVKRPFKVLRTHVDLDHEHLSTELTHLSHSQNKFDVFLCKPDDDSPGLSADDRAFLDIVEAGISKTTSGHLQVPLPFRDDRPLPSNKMAVYQRTKNTLNRLKRDPEKIDQCISSMEQSLSAGHVETIPQHEAAPPPGEAWWIPIFPVVQPKKNKVRLVYDASAKYGGTSLNDRLLTGPDQNNALKGVLLRFREEKVAIAADIQHMFSNYLVPPEQRNYLRYFWFRNNDKEEELVQYRSKVHIFGCSSSPAVANFCLRYAARSLEDDQTGVKELLSNSFYVDDALYSAATEGEATDVLRDAVATLKIYNTRLHKIMSNSKTVLSAFPDSERAEAFLHLDADKFPVQKTLGVVWDAQEDCFIIDVKLPDRPFTKRGILAILHTIYDPLGFVVPVTLAGRLIQRKILPPKEKITEELLSCDWDDLLPQKYVDEWNTWKESLAGLSNLKIQRCIIGNDFINPTRELHVFCDASDAAIGHVIYVKSINHDGRVHIGFLTANSKVAPRAATTTPRLELCAAVDAVLNARSIVSELTYKPSCITFYSDSTAVLGYISNNTSRFSRYVSNRIAVIRNLSTVDQWKYVPTDENPADIASRPQAPKHLADSSWFRGPDFLRDENAHLPTPHVSMEGLEEEVKEVTILSTSLNTPSGVSLMCERVNSWTKALRCMQLILRSIEWLRIKFNFPDYQLTFQSSQLHATKFLIKTAQQDAFSSEINILKSGKMLGENHPISKLTPFVDNDSILRVGGRLKRSDYPADRKHPILLPEHHIVTTLILRHYHEKIAHQGRHLTHGCLRDHGYHIINGKRVISTMIRNCTVCRKLRSTTSNQLMSDLPADRLEEAPPFTNTGLDVFGPYIVHDGVNTRSRTASKKVWVVIFTCLVTRAIHLELLHGLDTSSFRNALSRFISLRGVCSVLRSDNGTNFIATKRQLDSSCQIDVEDIKNDLLTNHRCDWKLNPPRASHCGGAWERKIGCVKRVLDHSLSLLKLRSLSRDEFATLLQEAAAIVNNTPLWEVSSHPDDPAPLSPASLITLRDSPNPPDIDQFSESDLLAYGKRRWRRVKYLSEQFWIRWRRDYLQQLQLRHKWKFHTPCATVGDIVLIRDKNTKRNKWPMARVAEVFPSDDGLVRRVRLLLPAAGNEPRRYLDRSIHDTVLLVKSATHAGNCNDPR